MTRKDYILIAAALRETLAHIASNGDSERLSDNGRAFNSGESQGAHRAALRLADTLANDNPRFDRAVFLKACSLTA
jgi:hypothetical protein